MKYTLALLACLLVFAGNAWSQARDTQKTINTLKSELDIVKARMEAMEQELQRLQEAQASSQTPSGGKQLALPDISFISQAKGKTTSDWRDPDKNRILLSEAELGIQGYVYPQVKADAFITASPAEDEPAQVEEAYLTYLGALKGLNVSVGKKHVSFGRTNLLHSHSWPYVRQPYVLFNFVAPESLTGQGANFSYLFPTKSAFFAQMDLGLWSRGDEGEETDLPEIVHGPGANLTDRFSTARLWTGCPVAGNGELELGGSLAGGQSEPDPITGTDYVRLRGVDLTYRHFWEGSRRLLLRAEGMWRRGTTDSNGAAADGYYLFGNYRPSKYGSVGLLYDWSEFPQAVNMHESALSLILTKQFSEQYYLRLMATHGARPDCGSFNELWLQWVWGVGPHTHNLE